MVLVAFVGGQIILTLGALHLLANREPHQNAT
jgi:hypothetical protein